MIPLIGNRGWGGSGGGEVPWSTEISVLASSALPNTLANNKPYVPLTKDAGDDVIGGFVAGKTCTIEVVLFYVMSTANSGDVLLTLSHSAVAAGEDPSAALSAGSEFAVTPGNDTLTHVVDSVEDASFSFAVTADDDVTIKIERGTGGGDTHTGDLRILRMVAREV